MIPNYAAQLLSKLDPAGIEFPADDSQFEDSVLTKVTEDSEGFVTLSFHSMGIGFDRKEHGFTRPVGEGDHLRLYGRGFGYPTRGMFINGFKVYYKTAEEEEHEMQAKRKIFDAEQAALKDQYNLADQYARSAMNRAVNATTDRNTGTAQARQLVLGSSASEWRRRYLAGLPVFTIVTGGFSFDYDEGIVACTAAIIGLMEKVSFTIDVDEEELQTQWKKVMDMTFEDLEIEKVGPSGAMMGAARNVAAIFWRQTPAVALTSDQAADRRMILLVGGKIQTEASDGLSSGSILKALTQ